MGGDGFDDLRGNAGADSFNGGASHDRVNYLDAPTGVTADLANPSANTGEAFGDRYASVEGLIGSNHDDVLAGDFAPNSFDGRSGADFIDGREGNDAINGGNDNDTLIGGLGADSLTGGAGTDEASYQNASSAVFVSLANAASNLGEAFGDTFSSIENLTGSDFC